MKPFNIQPALDKARRAKLHLDMLEKQVGIFLKRHPYRFAENDTGEPVDYFFDWDDFPSEFGLIAGDFVHNLRSSLDYLAFEANSISKNPVNKARCQFPIFDEKPSSPKFLKTFGDTFPYTPRSVKRLVDNLQPYNRRARRNLELLTILRELDNTDKHRMLLATFNWNLFIISSELADAVIDGIQDSFNDLATSFPYNLIEKFNPSLPNSVVFLVESAKADTPLRVVRLSTLREIYVLVTQDIIPKFGNLRVKSITNDHDSPHL